MTEYERSREVRHPVGVHGTVTVRVAAADVRVRGVEGDEARVVLRYALRAPDDAAAARIEEEFLSRLRRGEGRLEVETADGRRVSIDSLGPLGVIARAFGVAGDSRMELEVDVPRGSLVTVETISGDIVAEALGGSQSYRTISGDVMVAGSGDVRVQTTSGDARVQGSGDIGLEWHSVSGDLRAAAPGLRAVELDTMKGDAWLQGRFSSGTEHRARSVSGDLRLAPIGGMTVQMRSVSGAVRSEVPHRMEGRPGQYVLVVGDASARFRFESMSGDLLVLAAEQAAPAPATTASAPEPGAVELPGQLDVLRALERGEIDVDEALRRIGESSHA
ncbi:MAG: DUF4097 family beta strand repeat-containing protein [Candidatus Limnocylindrales bacterium]|jgi:hypothetical protein